MTCPPAHISCLEVSDEKHDSEDKILYIVKDGLINGVYALENQLDIQPESILSKNDIGSCRMLTSSHLWISFAVKMLSMAT